MEAKLLNVLWDCVYREGSYDPSTNCGSCSTSNTLRLSIHWLSRRGYVDLGWRNIFEW